MKKWPTLLLLFALACTTATTAPAARKPLAPDTVHVSIESRPDSAEVYLAGKFVGTTPMVARLTPGDHTIELRHPRHEPWKRELTVLPESPTRINAYLVAAK